MKGASLRLDDDTIRIFLNTKGPNDSDASQELIHFLHYLENTTDEEAMRSGSERILRIHEKVKRARLSEEVGIKYMQAWEERYYDKQEAREEGLAEGREEGYRQKLTELIRKKLVKGMSPEAIADLLEEPLETIQAIIADMH